MNITVPDYTDLVATTRRAGISDRPRPYIYVIHRADCPRAGANAHPLEHFAAHTPEALLRKARHSLNGKACGYCNPDVSARVSVTQ